MHRSLSKTEKVDITKAICYTPVFDSWIKERNAEVIGITSSQRFSSENRNMVILSPFAFLLYFPHFLFRDEF